VSEKEWDMEEAIQREIISARSPGAINRNGTEEWATEQMKALRCGEHYVPSHLSLWNKCSRDGGGGNGLAMGWHIVVAANPGVGKSLIALNLAAKFVASPASVGFLSLEMGKQQLTTRYLAIRSGLPIRSLEAGETFDREVAGRAIELATKRGDGPLYVDDRRSLRDIDEALAVLEDWRARGVTVFIIDYMQLLNSRDARSLREEVIDVSAGLADFAKSRNVLTVGVSQFNRETAREHTMKPTIQGLYGGMPMEADADQVIMIDHSRFDRDENLGVLRGARTWMLLNKNRHGPTTEIPVYIDYKTLRMTEALPDEEHLWPGAPKQ
jgi:replicative DNA helicase